MRSRGLGDGYRRWADDGGALGNVSVSAGGAWIKALRKDVTITTQALIGGGPTTCTPAVKYVGNGKPRGPQKKGVSPMS